MSHPVDQNTYHFLDVHVKAMHTLLNEMDPEARIQYIKDMLPELLGFSRQPTSGQQKLFDKRSHPVQNLSKKELELIEELAARTEKLYNTINKNDYFG